MADDNEALVQRLSALADRWNSLAEEVSTGSDWGPDVLQECAQELRAVLDAR